MTTTMQDERRLLAPKRGLAVALDWATAQHRRVVVLLVAFCLVAFLPGFFQISAVDREEARFAQATKQMLETGDYLDVRFQDEIRVKRPVGIYWLQAGAVKAGAALGVPKAPTAIWLYRLPSLFGAIGAVLCTYWVALAFVSRRSALVASLMLASSILLGVEARLAKADSMLLVTCLVAMGAFARIYMGTRRAPQTPIGWPMPALFWTALAAGVLLKGPVILMFMALTAATLSIADRSARWMLALKPAAGFAWMILLILPWIVAIYAKSGDSFLMESFGQDLLEKMTTGQEMHGAPPGYYLVLFWATFWPGCVLAGLAAPMIWRARREPGAQFLLAWLVPSWIVFEAVVTKLPHYVLPLYPAIAILIAGILEKGGLSKTRWMVRGTAGWFVLPAIVSVAVVIVFVTLTRDLGLATWPLAAAAIIFGLFAWWLYEVDGPERALLRGMAASVFLAITVYGVALPLLPTLFPSALIADEARAAGCGQPHVVSTFAYQEPSLVFLLGTETRFTDGARAAEFLRSGACHFALIDPRSERSFVQRADAIGLRYTLSQRIDGFNITIGRPVVLTMFRSLETP